MTFCWCRNLVLFLQVQLLSFLALLTQAVASAPKVVRCRATLMIRLVALQGVWLDRTEITQPFTGNSHEIEHTFTLCHLMLIFWHLHLLRFAIFQSFTTTHYVNLTNLRAKIHIFSDFYGPKIQKKLIKIAIIECWFFSIALKSMNFDFWRENSKFQIARNVVRRDFSSNLQPLWSGTSSHKS